MSLSLGVDTGGTFTDAVIVDRSSRKILSAAKALTTKEDLFKGITSAIDQCLENKNISFSRDEISIVCLSTTLATNAITEGYGGSVCEILIGYNSKVMEKMGFTDEVIADEIVWISGGHDIQGDEVSPLDEAAAVREIKRCSQLVESFAVSGYFSIRNPEHELRIKALVEKLTNMPVTCAHELTSRLNSVSRAVTVGYNAKLIPLLKDLLRDIDRALKALNIVAPLMIVKGDGAVVPSEWAAQRPIETILSGPAASCVGACHLTGKKNVWVADMGGTTTDIALLKNGRPAIHPEGAYISHRRSMVEAADIHTVGIGGDSLVEIDSKGKIAIGPRRALPLCALAKDHPEILSHLSSQNFQGKCEKKSEQFVTAWRLARNTLQNEDFALFNRLKSGPLSILALSGENKKRYIAEKRIKQLENRCLVHRSAFTPTDALHVLGQMDLWDRKASVLAAKILGDQLGMEAEAFCKEVVRQLVERIAMELIGKAMANKSGVPQWEREPVASQFLDLALNGKPGEELSCSFRLNKDLIAIGAPVKAYMPHVASKLNTKLILPEYAHVANAFGAATACIAQRSRAVIRMNEGGLLFRAHLPDRVEDFDSLEAAKKSAESYMISYATTQAQKAGCTNVEIETLWVDHSGTIPNAPQQEAFLDIELYVEAYGDPPMNTVSSKKKTDTSQVLSHA